MDKKGWQPNIDHPTLILEDLARLIAIARAKPTSYYIHTESKPESREVEHQTEEYLSLLS